MKLLTPHQARVTMVVALFVGLFASAYLLYTYVTGGPIACALVSGCEIVRASKWAYTWGIPRPLLGILFYAGLFALLVLPQLVVNLVQLRSFSVLVFGHGYRLAGPVAVLPFVLLFVVSLGLCAAGQNRRSIYLWTAWALCGVATLAKGPAGLAMPLLTLGLYLFLSGRVKEVFGATFRALFGSSYPQSQKNDLGEVGSLEFLRGTTIFLSVAAPWFAAMLARHGMPFWMELIGDNYVHRAQGRHGDRGTFEYYLQQIAVGMFPWSGVVACGWLGRLFADRDRGTNDRGTRDLALLCIAWFVVDFGVVTLVNTKFHHYILPALPPLAILAGLLLHRLGQAGPAESWLLLLVGLPVTYLSGRDLANFPARIGWLFNYDYVNVPNVGRPWPLQNLYGERYEYGTAVWSLVLLATLCVLLLLWFTWRGRSGAAPKTHVSHNPEPIGRTDLSKWATLATPKHLAIGVLLVVGLCVFANAVAPSPEQVAAYSTSSLPPNTVLPNQLRWGFLLPAGLCVAVLGLLVGCLHRSPGNQTANRVAWGVSAVAASALVWTCFVLDRFLVDISPHWSQKHVFASYFRLRQGPSEPVVAWMMYWRGENLYSSNQIYDHRLDAAEKTVFLGEHNAEKLQTYLRAHTGRRVFFLIERHRLESLRAQLPESARASLSVVDDSNNKVYLARAQL